MSLAALDLDLEVFNGPFDLLLTLVLNEEIDLLEVDLAEVVLAYVEYLERTGELDLEAATEFLVLIAALLELKSRLMLPSDEEEGLDIEPMEAAEELLARMLEYHRYRQGAEHLRARLEAEHGYRYRSAPLPPELRRISVEVAESAYDPAPLAQALGGLRDLLARRASFTFDEAVEGADRLTEAVTLFALLELYKAGEANWEQEVPFGPVTVERLADACEVSEGEIVEVLARLREHYAEGFRGVVLREVAGGFTLATDPVAEHAARRLLAKPRTPPLTQAQAECLAIVAYLQPVSRPEIARIRGVASESAVSTLLERGLTEEAGRSQFGAILYRTTELFQRLFGLSGLDGLPDVAAFDPSPEEEGKLRDRLLKAGEQRAAPA